MVTKNDSPVIIVRNVSKRFGNNQVLNQVDFDLPAGVIYGISGPNGVGKSVFLRILTGLILPDEGEIIVHGKRVGKETEFASSTGILVDSPGFLLAISGRRNLQYLARVSGKASDVEITEAIKQVGLSPADNRPVNTYSTGMRQRLGLAQAIMENPDLLILDEPTTGLDFDGQREIYSYLVDLRAKGKTILITSHSRDELKILCDEIFILSSGKLIHFATAENEK